MARSIWNGTITFGLVAVPIKVYSATESKTVHFHEVHAKDGSRIEHRRICPKEGKEVDYEDIVKGYEASKGKWVELTDDEIAAAAGSLSRRLEVDHFVPVEDIDPDFYERTYYLGTRDKGKDAYALLHAALEKSGRAGVGRWVFHNRERTVVLRTLGDVLAIHTMRFADELVDPGDFELGRVRRKPTDREIKMASSLVDGLHTALRSVRLRGQLSRGRPRRGQAQGRGQEHRAARGRRDRVRRRPAGRPRGEPGLMPRSLWTGSLGFGLVNVPVAVFSGVADTDLHFRQLHAKDHTPVEMHRFCAEEDVEVPYEEIASGYETDDGDLVILTDAELATAAPRKTRTIDIEAFVDLADVDPIYFDHPYVLMPAGDSEGTLRAYRLLVEVMSRSERAALGRFVLRTKEHLVLIRARERADDADHAAVPRRGPAGQGRPDADQARQAGQEGDRPGGGADRGPRLPVGSLALRGRVPEAPQEDRSAQAQGSDRRGARAREGALAGARSHGGARADARRDQELIPSTLDDIGRLDSGGWRSNVILKTSSTDQSLPLWTLHQILAPE